MEEVNNEVDGQEDSQDLEDTFRHTAIQQRRKAARLYQIQCIHFIPTMTHYV